jgi:hypothetical protein
MTTTEVPTLPSGRSADVIAARQALIDVVAALVSDDDGVDLTCTCQQSFCIEQRRLFFEALDKLEAEAEMNGTMRAMESARRHEQRI